MEAEIDSPLFLQVLTGLSDLEKLGIVHRDVKPTNLLMNANGQIKLCDFGISGRLDPAEPDFEGSVGTNHYLAPRAEKCSIQGDMWATGMSLFEIANGEHPMITPDENSAHWKISSWEPPAMENVSDEVNELISKL